MFPSGLNPLAPVFVPHSCRRASDEANALGSGLQCEAFGQLPDEVLATVLSWLEQPKDVFACARASKHLQDIAAYAPLRLHICQAESTARPKHVEDVTLVRQTLQGVCRHFKGVQMLDLSNTLVDDADISIAVEECPELQVLKLAGCRKLTSVGEALLAPDTGTRLEFLSLQRCFQTKDSALDELLEAAVTSKQSLQCIALSHLQLQQWPAAASQPSAQAAKDSDQDSLPSSPDRVLEVLHDSICPAASALAGSSLQALALHNCHGITPAGLQAVAAACPQLQMLFLGGSTLQVPNQQSRVKSAGQIPMLNSLPRSRAATIAGVLQNTPSCFHPAAKPIAAELAALVLQLQHLVLLETTFLPHGTRLELRNLLDGSCGNRRVQVLDMCESKSITAAVTYSSSNNVKHRSRGTNGTVLMRGKMQAYLKLLIEAAVNCSNAARQTPLHVAVDVDEASAVEALLGLGSGVNARDKGGATPLFVACESGHAGCAKLLLRGGADVVLRNSAGEAPLYIAALRGEIMVVDVLLQHMRQEGIRWQDGGLYGDGWTPLMAAAVADRHNIAVRLLSAAGSAVGALVRHANRYGQTAVHIAARKGSLPLLTALLTIGGPSVAAARDCVGISPADIASKNNHTAAVELLCSVAANAHTPRPFVHARQLLK